MTFFTVILSAVSFILMSSNLAMSQTAEQLDDKFRQLDEHLPTANDYRTASGAPGHRYWQQRADYKIDVTLNDKTQRITASAQISYHNNSPDNLSYLWLQLDQNRFAPGSIAQNARPSKGGRKIAYQDLRLELHEKKKKEGYHIATVKDANGGDLDYTINGTMMRIDLASPLQTGASFEFSMSWSHTVPVHSPLGARAGSGYFEKDDNHVYGIVEWFPRMAAYTDYSGWQNKQFIGKGEFTLEYGDYDVAITVPADHIVAATGELQNSEQVLTKKQRARLKKARTAKNPVLIVTPKEARKNEKTKATTTKTWRFHADNVRDFAFASSRKFIWDAIGVHQENGTTVMAMSLYPNEGNPLWGRYGARAVAHTLKTYSARTIPYPYPVAIAIDGPDDSGMEYPMICFNGVEYNDKHEDGKKTYDRKTRYGLISLIIHEVGHNYFPMIVNTDERQWTWMDEGMNSFLQEISIRSWEEDFYGTEEPRKIGDYMTSTDQVPIMTNSESIFQFGNNAYTKPTAALTILRDSIMGRELFDFAFREYARRWAFKRPTPSDFFRTMEDASAVDLDWFWRGWFYSTEHVDISLDNVRLFHVDTRNPDVEEAIKRIKQQEQRRHPMFAREKEISRYVDGRPGLLDFYNEHDKFTVTDNQRNKYNKLLKGLEPWERELLNDTSNIYMLDFSNKGGVVMPVYLKITYADGSVEDLRIPAEIWSTNSEKVSKMLVREKEITRVEVDPYFETADVDISNNHFPRKIKEDRMRLTKPKKKRDLMHEITAKLKK